MADINLPDDLIFPIPETTKEEDLYKTLQDFSKGVTDGFSALEDIEAITAGTGITDTDGTFSVDDSAIDHDNLINTHDLTTDIDHDTITNNHNLTTDIDHNGILNYSADRHFLMIDDDEFTTASATTGASSESIKYYVDNNSGSTSPEQNVKTAGDDQIIQVAGFKYGNQNTSAFFKVITITLGTYAGNYGGEYRFTYSCGYGQNGTFMGSGESPTPYGIVRIYRNDTGDVLDEQESLHNAGGGEIERTVDLSGWSDGDTIDVYTAIGGNTLNRNGVVEDFTMSYTNPDTVTATTFTLP